MVRLLLVVDGITLTQTLRDVLKRLEDVFKYGLVAGLNFDSGGHVRRWYQKSTVAFLGSVFHANQFTVNAATGIGCRNFLNIAECFAVIVDIEMMSVRVADVRIVPAKTAG
jgi:hypothetical protein